MLTVPLKVWICAYPASELDHEFGHRPIGRELSPIIAMFALNPQFEQVVCQILPPPPPQPVSEVNPLTSGGFPDPYAVRTIGFPEDPDFQIFNPLVKTLPH